MIAATALLIAFAGLQSDAASHRLQDASGRNWTATRNENGAVLRSGRTTIYLGKGCDARSRGYGEGRWGWANGGFLVRFVRTTIGFPRQEIDAGQGMNCRA